MLTTLFNLHQVLHTTWILQRVQLQRSLMFHQLLRPAQVHLIPQDQRQLLHQMYMFRLLYHLQHLRVVLSNRFHLNRRFPRPQLCQRQIPLLLALLQQRLTVVYFQINRLPPVPRLQLRLPPQLPPALLKVHPRR
jgi:hypothetical protein